MWGLSGVRLSLIGGNLVDRRIEDVSECLGLFGNSLLGLVDRGMSVQNILVAVGMLCLGL